MAVSAVRVLSAATVCTTWLSCVPAGLAQTTTGALTGVVVDPSGAVLPGAVVEIGSAAWKLSQALSGFSVFLHFP